MHRCSSFFVLFSFLSPFQSVSTTLIPVSSLLSLVFTKLSFLLSSPSLSALLLLSLSSSQHRESVFWLRSQLLPAPVRWQCQQRPGPRLHQKCLRAFNLFTVRLLGLSFLLLDRASASTLPKPQPFSHAAICQLSSSHPTEQSQFGDQRDRSPSTTTPDDSQSIGLRSQPITQ